MNSTLIQVNDVNFDRKLRNRIPGERSDYETMMQRLNQTSVREKQIHFLIVLGTLTQSFFIYLLNPDEEILIRKQIFYISVG